MRFSVLAAPLLLAGQVLANTLPLRVITFNIRYDASSREDGEKPWDSFACEFWTDNCRRYKLTDKLDEIAAGFPSGGAAVVGLQEVMHNQLQDILSDMSDTWNYVGVGRDDGKESGEYTPILYRPDMLKLLYSEVRWLSETPDVVSYGWGAKTRRTMVLAVFEHIATGYRFIHVNTHLDNVSSEARSKGILVAVDRIKVVQATYGPLGVSTGFKTGLATSRIDFIWFGNATEQPYTPTRYEIVDNNVDNLFISDHRPVLTDVNLAV